MWNETKQQRLDYLLDRSELGGLTIEESVELGVLKDDRIRAEAMALEATTQRINDSTVQTRRTVKDTEAQSQALRELIDEQQEYLAEVNALLNLMENRRQVWRSRYHRVTGRSLAEPISTAGSR